MSDGQPRLNGSRVEKNQGSENRANARPENPSKTYSSARDRNRLRSNCPLFCYYFATHPKLECRVTAVDIQDQRIVDGPFDFHIVEGTTLPFGDDTFDVVISNYLIEHVGGPKAQAEHLSEIERVMGPTSIGYLASPNRWRLFGPHFRLPFLSWIPDSWRDSYVRLMHRGTYYDCNPLSRSTLDGMLEDSGFSYEHMERHLIALIFEDTVRSSIAVPLSIFVAGFIRPIIPSFAYVLALKTEEEF